jgi:alpha-methylacyl-CoA racemase
MGPLHGIRIIEIVGVGPGPYAAMLLADMGAEVIRVERPGGGMFSFSNSKDMLNRNKKCIVVNLKSPQGPDVVKRLLSSADGLIEGNRPGVMEKLGLGPDDCMKIQPKLVYGRMTGWGQDGPLAQKAGHDINYLAITGALHLFGTEDGQAAVPPPLVGDFSGGGLSLAFGMTCALLEASRTGKGQVIDASIVGGVAHLMSTIYVAQQIGFWTDARASNILDGGAHFYQIYRCKDGRDLAVGAIEEKFYKQLLEALGLAPESLPEQMDRAHWPGLKKRFREIFATQTRDEWLKIFNTLDACVSPVLTSEEARQYPHNVARKTFATVDQVWQPQAAPQLGKTHQPITSAVALGTHTDELLQAAGYSAEEIDRLKQGAVIG